MRWLQRWLEADTDRLADVRGYLDNEDATIREAIDTLARLQAAER